MKTFGNYYQKDLVKAECQIYINVNGKTYLLKLICIIYNLHYSLLLHWTILFYDTTFIYWLLVLLITSHSFTGLLCFLEKVQGVQVLLAMLLYLSIRKKILIPFGECRGTLTYITNWIGILTQGCKIQKLDTVSKPRCPIWSHSLVCSKNNSYFVRIDPLLEWDIIELFWWWY